MKKLQIILAIFISFILSCKHAQKNKSEAKTFVNQSDNPQSKIETRIFRNDTIAGSNLTGFGYDIFVDGNPNPSIHQPHIPAVGGLKGFLTEEDAHKTAEYISEKLRSTHTLPTMSIQELDSLGIKH